MPKTAPKKPPLKVRKVTAAKKAGYTGKTALAAQQSVSRQYGMVKNEAGKWVKPDAAFLQRQMDASGWGIEDQRGALNAGTPVAIGGMRWLMGAQGMKYTGERSDTAKRNPGAAYGAPATGKGKGKGKGKNVYTGGGGLMGDAEAAAAQAASFIPYAEADTSTTAYRRAQGKAYGKGEGSYREGGTSMPPTEESAVVGEGAGGGGRKKKGRGKKKARPSRSPASRNRAKGRTGRTTARAKKK